MKGQECLHRGFSVSGWNLMLFLLFDLIIIAFFQKTLAVKQRCCWHFIPQRNGRRIYSLAFTAGLSQAAMAWLGRSNTLRGAKTLLFHSETKRCCCSLALQGTEAQDQSTKPIKTLTVRPAHEVLDGQTRHCLEPNRWRPRSAPSGAAL